VYKKLYFMHYIAAYH